MTLLNSYYHFAHTPFSRAIPPQQLFPSRGHQEIQGRLAYALQERLPALITGQVGTGKSTAVRAFVHALDPNLHPLVYLANPRLNVAALYAHI
jgi:type II secretory pathway predicted ATPase ExeA